jgi:dihydroflavonol-4-reductase
MTGGGAGSVDGTGLLVAGTRVLVTGGAGFVGSGVVRALLARNCEVVALVEPGGDTANLDGLTVDVASGDLRDQAAVDRAVSGCTVVFHVAALYRFWAPDPADFYDINVVGTRHVLESARAHGVDRVVYTSTVGTLGLGAATTDAPVDERSFAHIDHLFGLYKQSKYVAEHEVLRAAAEGLPVVLVQPTTPGGPRDRGPTPTGRTVLEFLNGHIPGYVDTTLNIVDVEDVAAGHLLAAIRGQVGRSYILGGENVTLHDVLATLAAVTGLPTPTRRIPVALALAAGHVSDLVEGRLLGREPSIPLEGARMSTTHMSFDDTRARVELGYTSRPAVEALERAARWFVASGAVRPERSARCSWPTASERTVPV